MNRSTGTSTQRSLVCASILGLILASAVILCVSPAADVRHGAPTRAELEGEARSAILRVLSAAGAGSRAPAIDSAPRPSPDGRWLAVLRKDSVTGRGGWLMVDLSRRQAHWLRSAAFGRRTVLQEPQWSPDSNQLVVLAVSGSEADNRMDLWVVDVAGRPIYRLTRDGWRSPKKLSYFSPDSSEVAFTRSLRDKGLWVVPAHGDQARPLSEGSNVRAVCWSADSTLLYYVLESSEDVVREVGRNGEGRRVLLEAGRLLVDDIQVFRLAASADGRWLAVATGSRHQESPPQPQLLLLGLGVNAGSTQRIGPIWEFGGFSPTGDRLLYTRPTVEATRSGPWAGRQPDVSLVVRTIESGKEWTASGKEVGQARFPCWFGPEGKEIIFVSGDNIMIADAELRRTRILLSAEELERLSALK